MVSRFPRLSSALQALDEKLREDTVSLTFDLFGQIVTIIRHFAFPPTKQYTNKKITMKLYEIKDRHKRSNTPSLKIHIVSNSTCRIFLS